MLMQNETACYCPENFRSMMGPIFGAEKSTVQGVPRLTNFFIFLYLRANTIF
jgi:hypothetical protein